LPWGVPTAEGLPEHSSAGTLPSLMARAGNATDPRIKAEVSVAAESLFVLRKGSPSFDFRCATLYAHGGPPGSVSSRALGAGLLRHPLPAVKLAS
jgi:hypothetical protein